MTRQQPPHTVNGHATVPAFNPTPTDELARAACRALDAWYDNEPRSIQRVFMERLASALAEWRRG